MKSITLLLILLACLQPEFFSQSSRLPSKLQFNSKEKNRISKHSIYRYQFNAYDSSNRPFSFSIKSMPSWLHYNAVTQSLFGKPAMPGQYPLHIIAFNADTVVHQRFILTVYNAETTNILCLGNSITNGTDTFNSYRRHLWQLLHNNNYNIDMIGSWSKHHMGGEMPDPDFDMDHDGHSGWTAADVLNPPDWDKQRGNIHVWLQACTPAIVLMELGTNEVFQCMTVGDALKNIASIIDSLRNKNARVNIFLAQIPPLGEQWAPKKLCGNDTVYVQRVNAFNKALIEF